MPKARNARTHFVCLFHYRSLRGVVNHILKVTGITAEVEKRNSENPVDYRNKNPFIPAYTNTLSHTRGMQRNLLIFILAFMIFHDCFQRSYRNGSYLQKWKLNWLREHFFLCFSSHRARSTSLGVCEDWERATCWYWDRVQWSLEEYENVCWCWGRKFSQWIFFASSDYQWLIKKVITVNFKNISLKSREKKKSEREFHNPTLASKLGSLIFHM